ncbi:MAG: nuclear transport factor 2 family protein [Candidatus Dormibacteraeota bacterium]|nr:nuclear transport factor 2 family protein [Candidatus Dormibacteraeota bacterium]
MEPIEMKRLIEIHLEAEKAGDTAGAVSVYVDDVEHDVVGSPTGPVHGKGAARGFYDHLVQEMNTEEMRPTHEYYGDDFCVVEHIWTGTVPGNFFDIPGHGRRISFRMLHLWEFRDGKMSRENVWLDGGSVIAQLAASSGWAGSGVPQSDERASAPPHLSNQEEVR